ncbi:MAG: TIGR00730 family Rossman fold protein [Saprospiraceae bacterium]|nr:TIGR00730 family Rossman fold protein [Saprospiraceae bacterium]
MVVTVFCSSSNSIPERYFEATKKLAKGFVERDITAAFGGGSVGLMGCLADNMLAHGGQLIGVIPEFMKQWERNHLGVQEMIFTENMEERKRILLQKADAVLALPGGVGTLDELFEALTLKRLGKFDKPIYVLNQSGFYDELNQLLQKFYDEKFMSEGELWTTIDFVDEFFQKIDTNA